MQNKEIGIYIHIPFCTSKCYYCNFTSYCSNEYEKYINSLCNEIISNSEILSERIIKTIYIGGGTPSIIPSEYIKQIINTLKLFNYDKNLSITIEVNPGSVNEYKIKEYKEIGINRISIGLQTTNDKALKLIGRKHTYNDFLDTYNLCKKYNINDISCDLIYPLPGIKYNDLKESLDKVTSLDITHISIYNLEIHENTKLDFLLKEGFASLVDEDEECKMRDLINTYLPLKGFNKYEISNFAKVGYESLHNLTYWNQEEYLGFGVASASFLNNVRYTNTRNLNKYIKNYENIENMISCIEEKEELDFEDLMNEYVILKLRLKNGVNFKDFYNKFKVDFYTKYKDIIDKHLNNGLLIKTDNNISLSNKGTELANIVWSDFI